MYAQDSIDMLQQAGIQFKRHEDEGILVEEFAELLMSSGLVLCEEVTWIAFARSVGSSKLLVDFSKLSVNFSKLSVDFSKLSVDFSKLLVDFSKF